MAVQLESSLHRSERFLERVKTLLEDKKALLILVFPDPDSLSSAWGFQHVLKHLCPRLKVSFAYYGKITRLQNKAMVHLLNIPVFPVSHISLTDYDAFATVDAQPNHFKLESPPEHFHIVIDHHPLIEKQCADLVDVRSDWGATATIIVEYIRSLNLDLPPRLATAICYGIKSDTQSFTRYSKENDVAAFAYCHPYANHELLREIEFTEIPLDALAAFHRTLTKLQTNKGRTYVHLGEMEETDTAVIIADFLMRVEHIVWVIISCIVNEKLVLIFRYNGEKNNAGKLAKRLFGELGSAGGHKSAARAEIPLAALPFETDPEAIRAFVLEKLRFKHHGEELVEPEVSGEGDVGAGFTPWSGPVTSTPNDDRSILPLGTDSAHNPMDHRHHQRK